MLQNLCVLTEVEEANHEFSATTQQVKSSKDISGLASSMLPLCFFE